MELPNDDVGRPSPDPMLPIRGTVGVVLVLGGTFILAWVLLLAHGFLEGTWSPAIEQRLAQAAAHVSADVGAEAGSAALVAIPLITLLGLSLMASIGGRMIAGGASLVQPDWVQILRRIELLLMSLGQKH